jgi:hypothetical protein
MIYIEIEWENIKEDKISFDNSVSLLIY